METLDGFILNLFRTEKPVLSTEDFEKENVWICDILNQDADLANEYVKFKLRNCADQMEKLQFLYSSRSCLKYYIEQFEGHFERVRQNPEYRGMQFFGDAIPLEQAVERISRYKISLSMAEQAICYFIDCSTIDCKDKVISPFKLSDKKGIKTDIIRVLNAMYEMRMIVKNDGQSTTKEEFMNQMGEFFGTDLSKYDNDLSQALNNTSIEANIKVFDDMKEITQNSHYLKKKANK